MPTFASSCISSPRRDGVGASRHRVHRLWKRERLQVGKRCGKKRKRAREKAVPAPRVIGVLGRLFAQHGAPAFIKSDNGPEFIALALQVWLSEQEAKTHDIDPARP